MNTIFKRIQPVGAKGKFPRLCFSSHTSALHAKLCHAATPGHWVENTFDEFCTLMRRIYMMYTPRRGFPLITCIFYLLWDSTLSIIVGSQELMGCRGKWLFLKIHFIRSVFRQASLRNLTSIFNPNLRVILNDFAKPSRFQNMPRSVACYRYQLMTMKIGRKLLERHVE